MTKSGPVALAVIAVAGVGLFAYGASIPVYTDFDAARELTGPNSCDANGVIHGWHERIDALRTMRHPLMQVGISLVLACATVWALFASFIRPDGHGLETPSARWVYFGLGFGVIGLSWFSQMHSLHLDLGRNVFPWCADTIAIPMYGMTIGYMFLTLVCLVVGAALSFAFAQLPVPLFQWRATKPLWSALITLPFVAIAAIIAFFGALGAIGSSFLGTPAAIVSLYLVEATRSALIARRDDWTASESIDGVEV